VDELHHVKDHVNGVAEQLPFDDARAAIESSGLRTKKRATRIKHPLEVKYGGLPGDVALVALSAGRSAMYFFEYSVAGKTWVACPCVMKCKTALSGLTIGTTYSFRVRAQTNKGLGDYCNAVTFTIH